MISAYKLIAPAFLALAVSAGFWYVNNLKTEIKKQKIKINNLTEQLKIQKANNKAECFEESLHDAAQKLEKGYTDENFNFSIDSNNTIVF